MPKKVAYTLAWSAERQAYDLYARPGETPLNIQPGSPAWFEWLDQASAFVFINSAGRCTVRKEHKQRGDVYWYAYHGSGKQLSKRYVGKTRDLTLPRLESVMNSLLANHHDPDSPQPAAPGGASSPDDKHMESGAVAPDETPSAQPKFDLLVATKMRIPRPRAQLVSRVHLFTQLEQGIQGSLTLISAPVGFGKTTLLVQWLSANQRPVGWLSLEPEDNQPTRFLNYLIAALQKLDAEIGSTSLPPLRSPQPPALESILTLLANEIAASQVEPLLLVLDDYHVITAEAIHHAIIFLLEHLPAQLRLIMLTRADPLLPLARLRARGQLTELRAHDLRFDLSEASTFLYDVMNVNMTVDDIRLLEQRTEGWVAGLQLAALSLRGKQDIPAFLRAFSGSHRFVLDYLSDEVIARQPEPILTFLLHTCLLECMCASLCSAMLGDETGYTESECQAMLEALEKANLFVNPLDERQRWYRYHQLFAVVLQARLSQTSPDLVPILHRRASMWFEHHGYAREAIHHALEIRDVARLTSLFRSIGWDLLLHGEFDVLLGWLQRLPDDLQKTQPQLCLYHAAALAFLGRAAAAEAYLQYAEQPRAPINDTGMAESSPHSALPVSSGEIAAVRTMIAVANGDLAQAVTSVEHARLHLPQELVFLRSLVVASEAVVYAINGDFRTAIQRLWEARSITQHVDNPFMLHQAMTGFAFFLLHLGQLGQVISTSQQMLRLAMKPDGRILPYAGRLCVVLGIGLYERNELALAEQMVRQGIELCQQMGEVSLLSTAYALLTQILYLEQIKAGTSLAPGHEVLELMQQAETLLWKEQPVLFWSKNYTAYFLVRLWIVQKNREAIAHLEQFYPINEQACSTPGCSYTMQTDAWGLAYMRFGQQKPESTITLLHWPIEAAERDGRVHHLVRMLILQSLAYADLDQMSEAMRTLKKALQIGEPEGYFNAFVEMDRSMAALLQTLFKKEQSALSPPISLSYVQMLLHELGVEMEPASPQLLPTPPSPALLEPLTERELEVLRFIGAGLSNVEIARQLVVEVSTVKWHVHHIYDKLQVRSRAQAILRAQEMELL